ncbi:MAG: sugar phosphate isomerase/epimerase [Bryobacteraceae bacterium]|nr:sugar phosphate isomerase/epimerase [Bryobacteraceae bacterium]
MNRRDLLCSLPALATTPLLRAADEQVPGKARLRNAICAYSYREELKSQSMSYSDLVRVAVETGAEGLDLTVYWFPPGAPDSFLFPLKRLAFKNAVEIYSISIRTDMCRPPGAVRDKEITEVHKWVDAAAKLGAGHIRVFGGTVPKGSTEDEAAQWAVETLKPCVEYAGSRGVILGLENHGGITERAERIIQIVKEVGSPWLGINLDTGNFNRNVLPQIEMSIPYAVNVQVKVEQRLEDGTRGPQDWDRIVQMLAKGNYRGYLALEYEARESAVSAVPRLTRRLGEIIRKYSQV